MNRPSGRTRRIVRSVLLGHSPCCHWCGLPLDATTATVEHFVPLASGGRNSIRNYVLACRPCNQGRGCRMPTAEHQSAFSRSDRSPAYHAYHRQLNRIRQLVEARRGQV